MPIYEYICHACGAEKEHLQKMSDSPVANCPECGSSNYVKKISAAGFQLKGTGWYVTDFKNKHTSKSDSKQKTESSKENTSTITTNATASTPAPAAPTTGQ